jgi:hypothetical protein
MAKKEPDYSAGLTDSEWMELIDGERDGLQHCCASISELRDVIIEIARDGCEMHTYQAERVLERFDAVKAEHPDMEVSPELEKLVRRAEQIKKKHG